MAAQQATVAISAQSDSYDDNLVRIMRLNQQLTQVLRDNKSALESTNAVYSQLSAQTTRYVQTIGRAVNAQSSGSGNLSQSLQTVQQRVTALTGQSRSQGLQAIQSHMSQITSVLSGNGNFANILTAALRSTLTQTNAFSSSLTSTTGGLATAGTAASGASAGIAGIGTTALAATGVVTGLVAAITALVAAMYKLGKGGYEYELGIANSENVLGSSFEMATSWATRLNDQLGIGEDRTLKMVASTAQIGRAAGIDSQSAGNMGLGANRLATQLSLSTGQKTEDVQGAVNSALNGSNSLGGYGINTSDNAAKAWLLQKKGIDAFNGSVSEATMIYARWMLIQEQAALLKTSDAESTTTLASMQLKLANTWDSVSKHAQVIFIPVLETVGQLLLSIGEGTMWVVNGFRDLMGMNQLSLANDLGPSASSIDAAGDLYSQYKKVGDQLDATKQQLMGFDEVQSVNPYNNAIPEFNLADTGLIDLMGEDGLVKGLEKGASKAKEAIKGMVSGWGEAGKGVSAFFNLDSKTWEQMDEMQKMLNRPGKWFIELAKKGDAKGWDLISAFAGEALHKFPIIAEIEALLEGDAAGFIRSVIQDGLLFNPITWPIGLLFKGFDILNKFRDENGSWDTVLNFTGLGELVEKGRQFFEWIQQALQGLGSLSVEGVANAAGRWISDGAASLLGSVNIPSFDMGGFERAASIATPQAQRSAAVNTQPVRAEANTGANVTINAHLGQGGSIIADDGQIERLARKMGSTIANQLKNTGALNFGAR